MRIVHEEDDWSQQSEPLIKGKDIDIFSAKCPTCGKQVQYLNGKASKHVCTKEEK
jgi:hypothetical protein